MDCPFIPGSIYRARDPEITFKAQEIDRKSGFVWGVEYHSMGGFVGPAYRLLSGRRQADKESPWDLVADASNNKK